MTISETVRYSFRHSYAKQASRLGPSDVSVRSEELPLGSGSLDGMLTVSLPAPFGPSSTPLGDISTLLYAGAGIRSAELIDANQAGIVLHRTTPVPGGMSAVELFLTFACNGSHTHTFYYSPHRHQLIRMGDVDSGHLAPRAFWPKSAGIAVCIHPDRLAGKYTNFALRLSYLQAGHSIGAIRNLAEALGLRLAWTRHIDFERTDELLGLPPAGLECVAWFDVDIDIGAVAEGCICAGPGGYCRPRPRTPETVGDEYRRVVLENRADAAERSEPVVWRRTGGTAPLDREKLIQIERETLTRTSGDLGVMGTGWRRRELDERTTSDFIARVASWISEFDSGGPGSNVDLVCAASCVAESARGVYSYDHYSATFVKCLSACALPVNAFGNRKYVTADSFSLAWLLLADSRAAVAEFGTNYYAELNLACGVIAQGICLAAAAHGLAARPLCDFDERALDRWLGAEFAGVTPMYVVVVWPAQRPTEYRVNWNAGDESPGL